MTRTRSLSAAAAALVGIAVLAGCDAERPVRPDLRPGEPLFSGSPPVEPFFVAYTGQGWTTELGIQTFPVWTAYGPGQYRVWVNSMCGVDPCAYIANFAASYPGRLYVVGDEPDIYSVPPGEYAAQYKFFVDSILRVDPTAKFSPAGFAEPTSGGAYGNYTDYAQAFYDAYQQLYGVPPRVDEWRFHNFGGGAPPRQNNLANWKSEITAAVNWSVAHGAPMYLGAWNFFPWTKPQTELLSDVQDAMEFLKSNPNIRGAGWYTYENFDGVPDYLVYDDLRTLTPHGETYKYGPMSVSISGNSVITAYATCTWYANVSGGVPPHQYSWTVNGAPWGTSSSVTYTNGGSSFTLRVDVTDKYGVVRSRTKSVSIGSKTCMS